MPVDTRALSVKRVSLTKQIPSRVTWKIFECGQTISELQSYHIVNIMQRANRNVVNIMKGYNDWLYFQVRHAATP